jgi:hypothetical protein
MRGPKGFLQVYNAQTATGEGQVILAAKLSADSPDGRRLDLMVDAARAELRAAGVDEQLGVVSPTLATGTRDRSNDGGHESLPVGGR